MASKTKHQVYDGRGQLVPLNTELGRGGEGAIFDVRNAPGLAAKIYDSPVDDQKAEKLKVMPGLSTDRLAALTAWPVDVLFDRPNGKIIGLLMPKIANHQDIHILYGVKSRLINFPNATWPFLVHAAANVARAFAVVHDHNHVIGDVNHGSVLVSQDATVKLIDCDSFQIKANGRSYPCLVGVPPYTPPEIQGQHFSRVIRTANHDNFGLAVFIFQLLFMGRHPFSGRYLGTGEMPIEKAIGEYRFAYGAAASLKQMKQPPGTASLDAVTTKIRKLFDIAFSPAMLRPTASEWIPALDELSKNLKRCQQNKSHQFLNGLSACPWCDIERQSGIVVFNSVTITWRGDGTFSITAIWAQINAVERPGPMPELPARSVPKVQPSVDAQNLRTEGRRRTILSLLIVCTAAVLIFFSPMEPKAGMGCLVVITSMSLAVAFTRSGVIGEKIEHAKKDAEARWRAVEERWLKAADISQFELKLQEMERRKQEYERLPSLRHERFRKLEADRQQRQLYRYLDKFRIEDARPRIRTIGPSRTATLESYGVETAADINLRAILAIPGFGAAYATKLLTWRSSIEQRFVFNPSQGIDPADLKSLDNEIGGMKLKIEQDLRSGLAELRRTSQQTLSLRSAVQPFADEAVRIFAQAEADWRAKPKIISTIGPPVLVATLTLVVAFPLKYQQKTIANQPSTQISKTTSPPVAAATPSPLPAPVNEAQTLFEQGIADTKRGHYSEAADTYTRAIALNPALVGAYHELGYANLRLKRYEASIAASSQAIKLMPSNAQTQNNLGEAYAALERWDDARRAFERARSQNPNFAIAYINLASACRHLRDFESAIAASKESIRLLPRSAPAHYEMGLSYLATGNAAAAFDEYLVLTSLNKQLGARLFDEINR